MWITAQTLNLSFWHLVLEEETAHIQDHARDESFPQVTDTYQIKAKMEPSNWEAIALAQTELQSHGFCQLAGHINICAFIYSSPPSLPHRKITDRDRVSKVSAPSSHFTTFWQENYIAMQTLPNKGMVWRPPSYFHFMLTYLVSARACNTQPSSPWSSKAS